MVQSNSIMSFAFEPVFIDRVPSDRVCFVHSVDRWVHTRSASYYEHEADMRETEHRSWAKFASSFTVSIFFFSYLLEWLATLSSS